MTPYTQTQIQMVRQKWLEWRLTPFFLFILTTFLYFHVHIPWRADMDINLADYGRKEINITYIWDAWLRLYHWIPPYDHLDDSVDWESRYPQQWPPLVVSQHFLHPGPHCGCNYAWWIFCCVFLERWESRGVMGLNPECLDMAGK